MTIMLQLHYLIQALAAILSSWERWESLTTMSARQGSQPSALPESCWRTPSTDWRTWSWWSGGRWRERLTRQPSRLATLVCISCAPENCRNIPVSFSTSFSSRLNEKLCIVLSALSQVNGLFRFCMRWMVKVVYITNTPTRVYVYHCTMYKISLRTYFTFFYHMLIYSSFYDLFNVALINLAFVH